VVLEGFAAFETNPASDRLISHMNISRPRGLAACVALSSLFTWPASGLGAQDVAKEKPVELPVYNVVDSRELPPPEKWFYTRIPGFEVLSNASMRQTRRLVEDFQRFSLALDLVWPGVQQPAAVPTTLIVCGRGQQFDQFLPADQRADRAMVSLPLRDKEQTAIIIDFQSKVLNLTTPEGLAAAAEAAAAVTDDTVSIGGGNPGIRVDAVAHLYREYVRFLLSGVQPRGPAWFEEGLSQILMGIEVTDKAIVVGKVDDPNAISTEKAMLADAGISGTPPVEDLTFNAALKNRRLLSTEEVLSKPYDSPEAKSPIGSTWSKQAAAFVHWGLYGNQGKHQKEFLTFIRRLDREPLSEALFKECFKQSYRDMGFTLRSYIDHTDYKIAGVEAAKGQKLPQPVPVEVREATEAEVGRLKGDALRLAGNKAAARTTLTIPYIRGERDPQLLAAIGLMERAEGDDAKARKVLEQAAKDKAVRPRAYLELARLRFAEAAAKPTEGGDRFNGEQTAAVLTPLFTARTQPPPLAEVYELIAETWGRSVITPGKEHLAVLDEGVRRFPRDTALIQATATQKIRAGLVTEAAQLIDFGLRTATDVTARQKLETLKASLPAEKK
jgi:hypothetical protein